MIFFEILFGIVFSFMYNKAKKSSYKYLIFYGINGMLLVDQFRSEKIFNSLVRIDTLVYIVSIILITWFLFNFRFERKYNRNGRDRIIQKD